MSFPNEVLITHSNLRSCMASVDFRRVLRAETTRARGAVFNILQAHTCHVRNLPQTLMTSLSIACCFPSVLGLQSSCTRGNPSSSCGSTKGQGSLRRPSRYIARGHRSALWAQGPVFRDQIERIELFVRQELIHHVPNPFTVSAAQNCLSPCHSGFLFTSGWHETIWYTWADHASWTRLGFIVASRSSWM